MKWRKYELLGLSLLVAGVIALATLEAWRPNWVSWKYNVFLCLLMAVGCAALTIADLLRERWAGAGRMAIVCVAALFKAASLIRPIPLGAWLVADTMFIVLMSIAAYLGWRQRKQLRQRIEELEELIVNR